MIVHDVLSHIKLAVSTCISLDVVITNGILLIAIISIANVTSPYFSNMSVGTCDHIMFACSIGHFVVLPLSEPRFGPKMCSALYILPCNITVGYHIAFHVLNKVLSAQSSYASCEI